MNRRIHVRDMGSLTRHRIESIEAKGAGRVTLRSLLTHNLLASFARSLLSHNSVPAGRTLLARIAPGPGAADPG